MRLFVALDPPDAWRVAAASAQSGLRLHVEPRLLRFVDQALMHLTLRFLGEVTDDAAARVTAEFQRRIREVDVTLALAPAGTFGPPARTSVAWLGVAGDRVALDALVTRVEAAVTAAGLPAEERPLRPHLTLARVHRTASAEQRSAIAAAIALLDAPPPATTRFREVVIVRSHLGGAQPRCELLGRYGTTTGSAP